MTRFGRVLLTAVVLGLSLVVPGCAAAPVAPAPPAVRAIGGETVLPVRWRGDFTLVEARIDGRGPYTFLLDTGASMVVVSPEVADAHPGGRTALEDGVGAEDSGGKVTPIGGFVSVGSLQVGDTDFGGFSAPILDLDFVSGVFGEKVDGVLGMPAFSTRLLVLDYPARQVRLSEGELPPADGRTILPLDMNENRPSLRLEFRGIPIDLLLDSGSSGGIQIAEWPDGPRFLAGPVTGRWRGGFSGYRAGDPTARLQGSLGWGNYRILDPIFSRGTGIPSMGTEVLGRFRITLDAAHGRVRFEGSEGPWRMEPLRGTGASILPSKGAFRVFNVEPGSPAATAGMREGDVLLTLDGVPADAAHTFEVMDALRGQAPSLRMLLRRDGKDLEIEVPLVDLVP